MYRKSRPSLVVLVVADLPADDTDREKRRRVTCARLLVLIFDSSSVCLPDEANPDERLASSDGSSRWLTIMRVLSPAQGSLYSERLSGTFSGTSESAAVASRPPWVRAEVSHPNTCVYRKLEGVVVMESAEDGERFDAPGPLTGRETGASLSNDRCVLTSL